MSVVVTAEHAAQAWIRTITNHHLRHGSLAPMNYPQGQAVVAANRCAMPPPPQPTKPTSRGFHTNRCAMPPPPQPTKPTSRGFHTSRFEPTPAPAPANAVSTARATYGTYERLELEQPLDPGRTASWFLPGKASASPAAPLVFGWF